MSQNKLFKMSFVWDHSIWDVIVENPRIIIEVAKMTKFELDFNVSENNK